MKSRSGFTLVELLVVILILATLGALSVVGVKKSRDKARSVVEMSAARNLVAGYIGYATENNGLLMPGYLKNAPSTANLQGETVSGEVANRYPFRLAPSVPAIEGVLFFNGNEKLLKDGSDDYAVSLRPNLGINANLVGGFFGGSTLLDASLPRTVAAYGNFYAKTLSGVSQPEKLTVFASARNKQTSTNVQGYFYVQPPNMTGKVWGSTAYTKDGSPTSHGYVDFRWDGKAVVAMLGGNVEMRSEKELRDMRLWSHQAADANDPDFMITRQ